MTTITAVSVTTVSTDAIRNTNFALNFGHALAVLPLHQRFTAKQICDTICPDFALQKCVAYLKKAISCDIMRREEIPAGVWVDSHGNSHQRIQALYYRI